MSNRFTILVCRGPECGDRRDGAALFTAFEEALAAADPLPVAVELERYSCFGRCRRGPNVLVREILPAESPTMVRLMPTSGRNAVVYHGVLPGEVRSIVEEHVRAGRRLQHLIDRGAAIPAAAAAPVSHEAASTPPAAASPAGSHPPPTIEPKVG